MSPKIIIIDTYYPEFLDTIQVNPEGSYAGELQRILNMCFGTFDAYSRNLRALGWDAVDVIANCRPLQELWARENNYQPETLHSILLEQIRRFEPDVVFYQDLSFSSVYALEILSKQYVLAGQCSCPLPSPARIACFKTIMTSFPHYLNYFADLGVEGVYVPLAFDPIVYDRWRKLPPGGRAKSRDCVFVGGMGRPGHWEFGMKVLESVARQVPSTQFYGYGAETLPHDSPIRERHRGPLWGIGMYETFNESRIVLNRHGEIAGEYANNLRMFEATGAGALLITDHKRNIGEFFTADEVVTYRSTAEAVGMIRYYLTHPQDARKIASAGAARTYKSHTYWNRMPIVSAALEQWL